MALLGAVQVQQQKYAEAEPLLRETVAGYEKAFPDNWARYKSQSLLGASLLGQKKHSDAEPLLVSGYEGMTQREAAIPADNRSELEQAGVRIVQLYESWGKVEKAAEWRQKLRAK